MKGFFYLEVYVELCMWSLVVGDVVFGLFVIFFSVECVGIVVYIFSSMGYNGFFVIEDLLFVLVLEFCGFVLCFYLLVLL